MNENLASPLISFSYFPCKHLSISNETNYNICRDCGCYKSNDEIIQSFKSPEMYSESLSSSSDIYKKLTSSYFEKISLKFSTYLQHRNNLIDWMKDIIEKLKLSLNTFYLSVYFLDYVIYKQENLVNQLQLYSVTCILLAAKSVELDERIPFISKIRKIAIPAYHTEDFKKSEIVVCDILNYNLNPPTLFELVEWYLHHGVVFSNDVLQDNYIVENSFNEILDEKIERKPSQLDNLIDKLKKLIDKKNDENEIEALPENNNPEKSNSNIENIKNPEKISEKKLFELVKNIEKQSNILIKMIIKGNKHFNLKR